MRPRTPPWQRPVRRAHPAMATDACRPLQSRRQPATEAADAHDMTVEAAPLRSRVHNHRPVLFLLACVGGLIPWTVGLAFTLPHRYVVGTWTATWTGFDVVLIGGLALTAWALWTQRPIALPAAVGTSVLMFTDAWFDLLTAHRGGDLLISAATAVFGEIPIAIVLATIAAKLLRAQPAAVTPTQRSHRLVIAYAPAPEIHADVAASVPPLRSGPGRRRPSAIRAACAERSQTR